jgi:hypothetical protein
VAPDAARPAAGRRRRVTFSERRASAQSLLAIDFQGVYQVNVAAAGERLAMFRFALTLLAAPFGAAVALVSARVLPPAALTGWQHLPRYLFALLAAFGLLAVLPYLRMIDASITHARTARAMNNFRLLYTLELRAEFTALGWHPNLPVDPHFPAAFSPLAWPGITAIALAGLEGIWMAFGLAGLLGIRPPSLMPSLLLAAAAAAIAGSLVALYHVRADRPSEGPPGNPSGYPPLET